MADLNTVFGNVNLNNPLVLASGTPGWNGEHLKKAADAGASAVVTKTIGTSDEPAMHPHCGRFVLIKKGASTIGMVNAELSSVIPKEQWLKEEIKFISPRGSKIIASVLAQPQSEETARLVTEASETGLVDLIELNVSAPIAGGALGARIGQSAFLVYDAVKAAKAASSVSLSVKLTPNVSSLSEIAKAAEDAGADGLVISNSIMGFAGVNIHTGLPVMPTFGGYTGPAIKPIISKLVAEVCSTINLPVMAVGGITRWEDVVEYIMLGASAVQICTAVMWEGYQIIPKLLSGLNDFLDANGYSSLSEIRGITLRHLANIDQYAKNRRLYAQVNESACSGCEKCIKVCFFSAVHNFGKVVKVDRNRCDGCGLCVQWCPKKAMELVL